MFALGGAGASRAARATVARHMHRTFPAVFVAGSTREVCQLTGQNNFQTGKPTSSETEERYGLKVADEGSSFEFNGRVAYLFGDAVPANPFKGMDNLANRYPTAPHESSVDNDAIAFAEPTTPGVCPSLQFVPQAAARGGATGAYTNPQLLTSEGKQVDLETNEAPVSGITVGGKMYVVFKTDNKKAQETRKEKEQERTSEAGGTTQEGGALQSVSTRAVMGELVDEKTLTFRDLYDFSRPSEPFLPGAKFVNVAIAAGVGSDPYLYFWGTGPVENIHKELSAKESPIYLARMPATAIGTAGREDRPAQIEYLRGLGTGESPDWGETEGEAAPLFHDVTLIKGKLEPSECGHTLGVQWNEDVDLWVMLYNCTDATAANPAGVYMRTAPQPWGPWSSPQTIFNPEPNAKAKTGFCYFIYSPEKHMKCPRGSKKTNARLGQAPSPGPTGSYYGPYFIAGWTTPHVEPSEGFVGSTFYYTLDTFHPYGQVILQSTIKSARSLPSGKPVKPGCKGTACT
jgi:hypothetical protein